MKLLIIEDEVLVAKSLQKLLEKRGHEVTVSQSGRIAVEQIKNHIFDRILCDLMLDDISGFDIIEETKGIRGIKFIREAFIIMTAYISDDVILKAKNFDCPLLEKPFLDLEDTIKLIETKRDTTS